MKLSLLVLTAGSMQGKSIPITLTQFLIGRDRQCHLRPASPLVSNRHCALLLRDKQVLVRDLGSTNGTFVNSKRLKGEVALRDQDQLQVGPVAFQVHIETIARTTKPASLPVPRAAVEAMDDEAISALLLAVPEAGDPASGIGLDSEGVPTGSTVMNVPVPAAAEESPDSSAEAKGAVPPATSFDTSAVAKSLLQKYRRESRR
jgi:pSer/pThr/pTyr-binding forkhead associated (FHA) protein